MVKLASILKLNYSDINLVNRFITALFLGINSGLLFGLLGHTFTAYLNDMHVPLITIGFLTIRAFPYHSKPLWAPIVDNIGLPFFPKTAGHRKSWILAMQSALVLTILSLGFLDINTNFSLVCSVVILAAFLAATHDIAMDAYRIELFENNQGAKGTAFVIYGFRIGLFASGTLGLLLSSYIGWQLTFISMALLILPCMIIVSISKDLKEHPLPQTHLNFRSWLVEYFVKPIGALCSIPNFYIIFFLVAFYKMSDGYLDAMLMPFLLDLGFTKPEIASYATTLMIVAGLMGAYVGSDFITRYQLITNLLCAELLAAITNLAFIMLALTGKSVILLSCISFIESFCSGISNIILIHYMSELCNRKFTATHYAILVCISGLTRTLLASTSGLVVVEAGWVNFFIISSLLSIPSLFCIFLLKLYSKK